MMISTRIANSAWLGPPVSNPTSAAGTMLMTGPKYGMMLHKPAKHPMNTAKSRPTRDNPMDDNTAMIRASSSWPRKNWDTPIDIGKGFGNSSICLHGKGQVQSFSPEPEKEILVLQEVDAYNDTQHQIQKISTDIGDKVDDGGSAEVMGDP